ncbi:hypothetical protein QVD99_004961 [Batrachochytrium dendrobatidis]|nr:hypothetical protein O5D80_004596 [Batrachochytrium dendrobatidis]KAK5664456.1 hypothetical protein QVD99_000067 [Batrachochytrium dendrobatidis]KAK5667909.1 hypothetical protein QVD99_004961 [Batrachochytrium dendrobatidis]
MLVPGKVSRRVGNWCEESMLREEKLREFREKIEKGDMGFMKRQRRAEILDQPVALSSTLLFGENMTIKSMFSKGFLTVNTPECYPDLSSKNALPATVSLKDQMDGLDSKARMCFRLERKIDLGPGYDKQPRWGEHIYITIHLPQINAPLYLASKMRSMADFKSAEKQQCYFSFDGDSNAVWKYEWSDAEYRMEMEGTIIEPGTVGVITHLHTGRQLYVDSSSVLRGDFGTEWNVNCEVYKQTPVRSVQNPNHWMFGLASSAKSSQH